MRFILQFVLSVIGALALACALSYPLFELIVPYAPHVRFDRLATRLFQLMIIVIVVQLCRAHQITSRAQLGLAPEWPILRRQLWRGWWLGVVSLVPVAGFLVLAHLRISQNLASPVALFKIIASAIATGWAVAWFEELLFRGILQRALRPLFLSPWPTCGLLSVLFASVHFLSRTPIPAESVTPASGWLLWQGLIASFLTPERIADAFVALIGVGLFLSWLTERSGSIGLAVGTHAGWVTVIKLTVGLTALAPNVTSAQGINPQDGFVGWAVATWSLILLVVLVQEPALLGRWLYPERYSPD